MEATTSLVYTYSSTDQCYIIGTRDSSLSAIQGHNNSDSDRTATGLDNTWQGGPLVIPATYDDGVNGEWPVKGICYCAFYDIQNITSVTMECDFDNDFGITHIGARAFQATTTTTDIALEMVHLSPFITYIGLYNFARRTGLRLIDFEVCVRLTTLNQGICLGCTNLEQAVIPYNISQVYPSVFAECTNLKRAICLPSSVPSAGSGFSSSTYPFYGSTCSIYCSDEGYSRYVSSSDWSYVRNRLEAGIPPFAGYISIDEEEPYIDMLDPSSLEDPDAGVVDNKVKLVISVGTDENGSELGATVYYRDVPYEEPVIPPLELVYTYSSTDDCYIVGDYTGQQVTLTLANIENDTNGTNGVEGNGVVSTLSGGELVIPATYNDGVHGTKPVKGIACNALFGCVNITSITIPYTMEVIGAYSLGIPSSIGAGNLEEVIFEDSNGDGTGSYNLEYIGAGAFQCQTSLTELDMPNTVTYLGQGAFISCSALTSISLSTSLTAILLGTFKNCTSLTSITIPNSVTSIAGGSTTTAAFNGCSSLQSITLPFIGSSSTISAAGSSALFGYIFGTSSYTGGTGCSQRYASGSTVTYYIPTTLRTITVTGGNLFYGAFSALTMITTVNIQSSVTIAGYCICYGCSNSSLVVNIYTTNATTKVSSRGANYCWFYNCNSNAKLHIPNSVTTPTSTYGTYWRYYNSSSQLSYSADL